MYIRIYKWKIKCREKIYIVGKKIFLIYIYIYKYYRSIIFHCNQSFRSATAPVYIHIIISSQKLYLEVPIYAASSTFSIFLLLPVPPTRTHTQMKQ